MANTTLVIPCNNLFGNEHTTDSMPHPEIGDSVIIFRDINGINYCSKPALVFGKGNNSGLISKISDRVVVAPLYGDPNHAVVVSSESFFFNTHDDWAYSSVTNVQYQDTKNGRQYHVSGAWRDGDIEHHSVYVEFYLTSTFNLLTPTKSVSFMVKGWVSQSRFTASFNGMSIPIGGSSDWKTYTLRLPKGKWLNAGSYILRIELNKVQYADFYLSNFSASSS